MNSMTVEKTSSIRPLRWSDDHVYTYVQHGGYIHLYSSTWPADYTRALLLLQDVAPELTLIRSKHLIEK
jgi:hypothetical protein